MTAHTKALTETVDQRARHLVDSFRDGIISEHQARQEICGAIFSAGVVHRVRDRYVYKNYCDPRTVDEILGILAMSFVIKVFAPPSLGGLDFDRVAAGQSVCGWANQLLSKVVVTSARTARNALIDAIPFSELADEWDATLLPPAMTSDEQMVLLAETLGGDTPPTPDALARMVYGLPRAIAPSTAYDRFAVRTIIERDHTAAWTALTNGHRGDADPYLTPMWDDYDARHIQSLQEMELEQTHALTTQLISAEVAAAPRPNARTIKAFTTAVIGLSGRLGWTMSVTQLCQAYVCVDRTLATTTGRRTPDSVVAERFAMASHWRETVELHRNNFPATALGATTVELEATLDLLLKDSARQG